MPARLNQEEDFLHHFRPLDSSRAALLALAGALAAAVLLPAGAAEAAKPAAAAAAAAAKGPTNDDCLGCHGDKGATREAGGSVFVDSKVFEGSVHGAAGLSCTDCHTQLAKAEMPHDPKVGPPQCETCHEGPVKDYAASAHAALHKRQPGRKVATCAACHGSHDILPVKDPKAPTSKFNVPKLCVSCHGDPKIVPAQKNGANEPSHFADSIHGKALVKAGLSVAPSCVTCHGPHTVLGPNDPKSTVARDNVPALCGSCHQGIVPVFEKSVHGEAVKKGNPKAPACDDCHASHEIERTDVPGWQLEVIKECGGCHADAIRTYRDTYHGQITNLGFTRVATCAACHGSHDILGPADPRSTVSKARIVETCRKCHPNAGPSFAKYDPHADSTNKKKYPLVYWTSTFMKLLLGGVFIFFGIHTLLWLPRSFKARRDNENDREV